MANSSSNTGKDSIKVLTMFDRLIALPNADPDVAMLKAAYMETKQMPKDSINKALEKVLDIAPDNAAARLRLVQSAWQEEDKDRVIDLCSQARQYNPEEMVFYYFQGIAYYQKGEDDKALDACRNGVDVINDQSEPGIVSDFYSIMGDILHKKGLDKEAYVAYDSCLQWKPDNIGALNNYAYYLRPSPIPPLYLSAACQSGCRSLSSLSPTPRLLANHHVSHHDDNGVNV